MEGGFPTEIFEPFGVRATPWKNRMRDQRLRSKSSRETGRGSVTSHDRERAKHVEPAYYRQIQFEVQENAMRIPGNEIPRQKDIGI
jgi:hypothetical protein